MYYLTGYWWRYNPHNGSGNKHDRPQARAWGHLSPSSPWKCYKVICALVVTVNRSIDQLFMHHFHNFSSARTATGVPPLDPAGDFRLQTP